MKRPKHLELGNFCEDVIEDTMPQLKATYYVVSRWKNLQFDINDVHDWRVFWNSLKVWHTEDQDEPDMYDADVDGFTQTDGVTQEPQYNYLEPYNAKHPTVSSILPHDDGDESG